MLTYQTQNTTTGVHEGVRGTLGLKPNEDHNGSTCARVCCPVNVPNRSVREGTLPCVRACCPTNAHNSSVCEGILPYYAHNTSMREGIRIRTALPMTTQQTWLTLYVCVRA